MGQSFSLNIANLPCANSLSSRERAKAAIIGAFVADAATMPLHWIYDQEELQKLVTKTEKFCHTDSYKTVPEFWTPSQTCSLYGDKCLAFGNKKASWCLCRGCPIYKYPTGKQSPYGDEAIPLMYSLSEKGHFDIDDARESSYQFCKLYNGQLNKITKR